MMQINKKSNNGIKFVAEGMFSRIPAFVFLFTFILFFTSGNEIRLAVHDALSLCVEAIIPSVFPFMVISDYFLSLFNTDNFRSIKLVFSRIFSVKEAALAALFSGIFCGFPIGPSLSLKLYNSGKISKKECERLIALSNNASPAFVISGVGAALFGSVLYGIILYFSELISIILTGLFTKERYENQIDKEKEGCESFSLPSSIRSASEGTLYVVGFIVSFSIIIALISKLIKNSMLLMLLSPFLEIANATKMISTAPSLNIIAKLTLTSFAIGFSGFSVHMQTKAILIGTNLSMKKYYLIKLISGVFSSIITYFLTFILLAIGV